MPLHSIRHQRTEANPAMPRGQFDPASSLDLSLSRELRRDLYPDVRSLLFNSVHSICQVPFVEVFEQPTIVQMQIKFCVYRFSRFTPCHREKSGFSIREIEALGEQERLIPTIRVDWPL